MKILRVIKNIVIGLIVLLFFAFATVMALTLINRNRYGVTQFGDTSLVFVNKRLANDKYQRGDLVIVESNKLEDYDIGQEIFVYLIKENNVVHIEVGNIEDVDIEESRIKMQNGGLYKDQYIIGSAVNTIPTLGSVLSVIGSTMGFLFIVLIPCFLIFIYQIYALIVEIKYGKLKQ